MSVQGHRSAERDREWEDRKGRVRRVDKSEVMMIRGKIPAPRILVIDDNPEVVDILVTCFREDGYRVLSALTGDDGLKNFIVARPDLVLLDFALPGGMNGIELLRRIRSINPTSKVVMVTGNADPELAREALERGALAYVDQPCDFDYLKRVVAMALGTQ